MAITMDDKVEGESPRDTAARGEYLDAGSKTGPGGPDSPASASVRASPDPEMDGSGLVDDRPNVKLDRSLIRKIDLRLCTIAGLLCALDLIDSGVMSSASATSMPTDLGLVGGRYSTAIWIVTLAQVVFKLPATIAMRLIGPPIFFTATTICFGLITLCMAYVADWRQMIALRFLMGLAMSGVYPGLACLISAW